jgi:hypothetical protein
VSAARRNLKGAEANIQAEACSEPEVAFHIDDPPLKRGSQLQNSRPGPPEG